MYVEDFEDFEVVGTVRDESAQSKHRVKMIGEIPVKVFAGARPDSSADVVHPSLEDWLMEAALAKAAGVGVEIAFGDAFRRELVFGLAGQEVNHVIGLSRLKESPVISPSLASAFGETPETIVQALLADVGGFMLGKSIEVSIDNAAPSEDLPDLGGLWDASIEEDMPRDLGDLKLARPEPNTYPLDVRNIIASTPKA